MVSHDMRKVRWLLIPLLLAFVLGTVPSAPVGAVPSHVPSASKPGSPSEQSRRYSAYGHFFPETFQASSDHFWYYWNEHGGLAQLGYPISEERIERSPTDGKEYLVQYYERAVFELHPELSNRVLLSLLGNFEYRRKYPRGAPNQMPNTSPGSVYFSQTGKRLGGGFLEYWQKNGGLAQQGYPISDEFAERSPIDGKVYTVQYFERAVFEFHPEQRDPRYRVLLSQLGTLRYGQLHQSNLPNLPGDVDGDKIRDANDICPRSPERVNKVLDADGCPDTMQTVITLAAEDLDTWWAGVFRENQIRYLGPDIFTYLPGNDDIAFYNSDHRAIIYYWGSLSDQLQRYGDFAPLMVIAHEWGHLVQDNLGVLNDPDYLSISMELQADCYAGAWAQHSEELGYLEEGDLEEATNLIFNQGGDPADRPWFDEKAHGQPEERYAAFIVGYRQGVEGCGRWATTP